MIGAVVTRGTADAVARLLPEAQLEVVERGGGGEALGRLSRLPVEAVIVDIDALGPDPAAPLLAFGLAREGARVILLAQGREPGDKAVAAAVGSRVVTDVVAGAEELPSVLSRPPGGLASLARWLRPDAVGGQAPAKPEERPPVVIERQVPLSARPTVVAVASVAPGSGCSYTAAAITGSLAALGYGALLLDLAPVPGLTLLTHGERWVPGVEVLGHALRTWGERKGERETEERRWGEPVPERPEDALERIAAARRAGVAPYVVADLGATPPRDPLWAGAAGLADLLVLAGPAGHSRAAHWYVWAWQARAYKLPHPAVAAIPGGSPEAARRVAGLLADMEILAPAVPVPVVREWSGSSELPPPGYRDGAEDRAVREAVQALLGELWPRETVRRQGLLGRLLGR